MNSPWGLKESDMTEQQSKSLRLQILALSVDPNIPQTAMFHLKESKTELERRELEIHS